MAISQRGRFVEKVGNLIELGYRTKTIVNALQFKAGKAEDGSVMHDGLPYPLKKSQANNLVRQVRKARGIFMPLGDVGNYQLQKEAEIHRKRQAQIQKSFNASSEVIKKNHNPKAVEQVSEPAKKPCITDEDADRVLKGDWD